MSLATRFLVCAALLAVLGPAAARVAAPVRAPQTAAPLVAGQDYAVIKQGLSWQPVRKGEVEVVEVFAYWCPHCAHFDPIFQAWKARQNAAVRVVQLPAAFEPDDASAQAAFALQRLGVATRATPAIFRAIHQDGSLPKRPTAGEFATFATTLGLRPAAVQAEMQSPRVADDMRRARNFLAANNIDATPTLIVNGRYRVLGRSLEDQTRILDRMIARLRTGAL